MTAKQIAENEGRGIDAIRKRWNTSFPGISFSADAELSPEMIAALSKERAVKAEKSVSDKGGMKPLSNPVVSKGVPPVKKKIDVRAIRSGVIDLLLCAIVAGHAILIWYDCSVLWGVAGLIGGGLSFLVVLAALLLSTDDLKPRTSETAIWFIFLVDGLAWKAHYDVFVKAATTSEMVTGVICAFFCACSFVALYLFRDSKLS